MFSFIKENLEMSETLTLANPNLTLTNPNPNPS